MKCKLLILLPLFMTFSIGSKSQNLTFEQTVDYLKSFVKGNKGSMDFFIGNRYWKCNEMEISVEKAGRVTAKCISNNGWAGNTRSFSAFDVVSGTFGTYSWGNPGEHDYENFTNSLQLFDKDKKIIAVFTNLTLKADADRLYKAILYLQKVCDKSADPFGN